MAGAYRDLSVIARIRGDFEQAEELHRKALQIHEQLGIGRGWRRTTGAWAISPKPAADFEQAEELYRKALQINEGVGGSGGDGGGLRETGRYRPNPRRLRAGGRDVPESVRFVGIRQRRVVG